MNIEPDTYTADLCRQLIQERRRLQRELEQLRPEVIAEKLEIPLDYVRRDIRTVRAGSR